MIKPMSLLLKEREVLEALKKEGLLQDLSKKHFRGKEDVVVVGCPDGRQFVRGIFNSFMDMYDETHKISFHPLLRHGGTLVLDAHSPLVLPGHTTDKDLIHDIKDAIEMGYKAICLVNHFPCGMARKHNIHPMRIIESLMRAKERIKRKEGLDRVTVACFLQVTDGDERSISYISYDKYHKYISFEKHQKDDTERSTVSPR